MSATDMTGDLATGGRCSSLARGSSGVVATSRRLFGDSRDSPLQQGDIAFQSLTLNFARRRSLFHGDFDGDGTTRTASRRRRCFDKDGGCCQVSGVSGWRRRSDNVELFSSIPLGNGGGSDGWDLHFDSKGIYRVRSGYRVAIDSRKQTSLKLSSPDSKWWRLLWRLKIPPKVRIFIWRCFHDLLPTMFSLKHRGSDVWLPFWPGELKLNVDAVMISSANFVGVGGVVRDHNRFVCAAFAITIPGSFGSFIAECIAFREGLAFVRDLELRVHVVESNALNVITAVQCVPSLDDTDVVLDNVQFLFVWMIYAADGRCMGQGLVLGVKVALKMPTEDAFDFRAQMCALVNAVLR
ncbi:hypothetical protein TIFTF001_023624 [Ficus carica]|uniref:Uncharacterized protein n=1 Tax=Ficus carica TaxID=3494 RepID=A0AA88ALA1_FICCA|nr:hypothetical protein TIFTF001_023624 [Ficus carica]